MSQNNAKDTDKFEIRKHYYASGALWWETPYVNGEKHGIEKYYYRSGVLSQETPYVNGKKHGLVKVYYESGALDRVIPYVNGKTHGIGKEYNIEKSDIDCVTLYNTDRILLSLWFES